MLKNFNKSRFPQSKKKKKRLAMICQSQNRNISSQSIQRNMNGLIWIASFKHWNLSKDLTDPLLSVEDFRQYQKLHFKTSKTSKNIFHKNNQTFLVDTTVIIKKCKKKKKFTDTKMFKSLDLPGL